VPDDGVVQRLTGLLVPHDRRFTLVGDSFKKQIVFNKMQIIFKLLQNSIAAKIETW
jgi:hypothetical protein